MGDSNTNKIISSIVLFGTEYVINDEQIRTEIEAIKNNYATKEELQDVIGINLDDYAKISDIESIYATKEELQDIDVTSQLDDYATKHYVGEQILRIVGEAPETLDTLKEIADALEDKATMSTVSEAISTKANASDVYTKNEIDSNYATKQDLQDIDVSDQLDNYYTKEETERRFLSEQDLSEQLANIGVKNSNSIPVYDLDEYEKDKDTFPENQKYILMQDTSTESIVEYPESETYNYTGYQSYLDILFSTIRALQDEVTKLKNSFNYGIESYNGKQTSTSTVISEYEQESEPLWAVDENSLAEITDNEICVNLNETHILQPKENVEVHEGFLVIPEETQANHIIPRKILDVIYEDNKIFLYLTANSLDINFKFSNLSNINDTIDISLSDLVKENIPGKFNILVVVNRSITKDSVTEGKNFIWFSIHNYIENGFELQGYYNKTTDDLSTSSIYLDNTYIFDTITFNGPMSIYKMNFYSRSDNFLGTSNPNIEETPRQEDYKYKAAHITVRVIDKWSQAQEIKDQLLEGEPIYIKDKKGLFIIIDGTIKTIGSTSSEPDDDDQNNQNTGMTQEELIEILKKNGIVNFTENGGIPLEINSIADITFIHQNTGNKFKFEVDKEGNLHSTLLSDVDMDQRVENANFNLEDLDTKLIRGFIGTLHGLEAGNPLNNTGDFGINSDRLKIGAVYAPNENQKVFGCSHAYIELENTSNKDINLDNFYIHYGRQSKSSSDIIVSSLKLKGIIPAGGTYLIRGKQYSSFDQANTYIKVKTYDIEWYDENELIDFTWHVGKQHTYLLTYGLPENFSYETVMTGMFTFNNASTRWYHPRYVDSIAINSPIMITSGNSQIGTWFPSSGWQVFKAPSKNGIYYDVVFKNVFMLDPAKQAYQGLYTKDSSRIRNDKATDLQYLVINNEYIEFPKTKEKCLISKFTPKASFEHKNVCTDKTELDMEKPNMVTSSFGMNIHKTRCFNWISAGYFDEFIWVRKQGDTTWKQFESYKNSTTGIDIDGTVIGTPDALKSELVYPTASQLTDHNESLDNSSIWTTNTPKSHWNEEDANDQNTAHLVKDANEKNPGDEDYVTTYEDGYVEVHAGEVKEYYTQTECDTHNKTLGINGIWYTNTLIDHQEFTSSSYPYRKKFGYFLNKATNKYDSLETIVYDRITSVFPGCEIKYTSHKCVLEIVSQSVDEPTVYEYIVGRENANHLPDDKHSSEIQTFTLYPESYVPRIYQTTDQQGFTWIEYQPWAAAAEEINKTIAEQTTNENIIPVLINTGDMTQNGTRINEWLDYYNGGICLFNHLEQMNVVGNNDLCNTDPTILGTGDDPGKSNGYYFHVFYCYEIDLNILPIISNVDSSKYIPSFYYFGNDDYTFIMFNTEITYINCGDWYKQKKNGRNVNIYTGWSVDSNGVIENEEYDNSFKTIYTMLYEILTNTNGVKLLACHEMPFTVITNENLNINPKQSNPETINRSLTGTNTGNLVGSHCNLMNYQDKKSNYWFSRLLEHFGIKLVLGGHKHTYACTWPLRELYMYQENGEWKDS